MGLEWLNYVVTLLEAAGLRADEEYAVGPAPHITEPVAAVGLSGLQCARGQADITVRLISPRTLGGWTCQSAAVQAVAALEAGRLRCQMGKMTYLSDCDCYSIAVTVAVEVCLSDGEWVRGSHWSVQAGDTAVEWVTAFAAEQDQGRTLIRATCQTDPVGITPGTGGWVIRLTQQLPQGSSEAEMPAEPFVLTASDGVTAQTYTGCGWNQVSRSCDQSGMTVQWQGFALSREVAAVG